jgi:hypothetical protein
MLVAKADTNDPGLEAIMDEALSDVEGWSA